MHIMYMPRALLGDSLASSASHSYTATYNMNQVLNLSQELDRGTHRSLEICILLKT